MRAFEVRGRRLVGVLVLALAGWVLYVVLRTPVAQPDAVRAFTSSEQCRTCHTREYAEWSGSWHAQAWSDPEVRALSNDFANTDCIDCHASRPVFETGIGERVLPRSARRGEGIDCIACHLLPAGHVSGGLVAGTRDAPGAACRSIALRDLGSPGFCAGCHDQHDTTKQWKATDYAARGVGCVECHMPLRPGASERRRDHTMTGGHDIDLVRKAVDLRGVREGGRWVIEVENVGAGHHFPTEERSRAADVFWRPLAATPGAWRHVYRFRSPYHHEDLPDTLLAAHEVRRIPIEDPESTAAIEVALFYTLKPYWADPARPDPEHEARLVRQIELQPRLDDVSATRIPELEAKLPSTNAQAQPDPEIRARARSLVGELAQARGKMRATILEDLRAIGEPAVEAAAAMAREPDRDEEARRCALDTLGAIDTESSSDALVALVDLEVVREPWVRAQAAFQLTRQSSDHILLRLLSRLKYETDGETIVWIAAALAKHGNYAGVVGLRTLSLEATSEQVREDARSMHAALAKDAGYADAGALDAAWFSGSTSGPDPSPRLRLEVGGRIADLSRFDLRLVDDARFALSRSAPWVVELLVSVLHEKDPYVRVHAAQTLERMGPRARAACSELVPVLDEPGMGASAATAIGSIGCVDSLDPLAAHTREGFDPELRNAAAAALGRLGSKAAIPCLARLIGPGEPLDLRQTAAEALIALDDAGESVPLLLDCLTLPGADPDGAESALEAWLARTSSPGSEALEGWKRASSVAEIVERRRVRAGILRASVRIDGAGVAR